MKMLMIATIVAIATGTLHGQSTRSLINEGNDLYEEKKYDEAEINYRKALNEDQTSVAGTFNLGNALNKQGKFDQSASEFEAAALKAEERDTRADAHYNRGNSFLEATQYDRAIASYVEALKLDSSDMDAKYNLSYALMKRRQQQQQQQQGGGKNDQNKDQKQDQKNKDQKKDDQKKNDQQDQNKQQQDKQDPQEQQQNQQQKVMSRADAERILEVLKNEEKEVQKKLRAKAQTRAKTDKDW